MMKLLLTILTISTVAVVSGCASLSQPASQPIPMQAACEAMRPSFPIPFHGPYKQNGKYVYDNTTDRVDTIQRVREANARFKSVCP